MEKNIYGDASVLRNALMKGGMFLSIFLAFIFAGFFPQNVFATSYSPGDVLVNEFRLDGVQWVELLNTTNNNIDLGASTWEFVSLELGPGGSATTTLSGLLPANGLITLEPISTLSTTTDTFLSLKNDGTSIYTMSYGGTTFGEPHLAGFPSSGESAYYNGAAWATTAFPTRGWYNGAPAPTIASIVGTINSSGVTTNWLGGIVDSSAAADLYFEKTGFGRVAFSSVLNLTSSSTKTFLQNLGSMMDASAGRMNFDARTAYLLKNAGATISIYKVNEIGYDVSNLSTTSMTVKDDTGNVLSGGALPLFSDIATSTANSGTFTFTTSHFTQFGFDPIVQEVRAIGSTSSTSPYYVFSSNVNGSVIYGGSCSGTASASTTIGDNTVTFGPLAPATYADCTVKVVDGAGASTTLAVSSFDVTLATNPSVVDLGTAGNFVILSKSGISNTGTTAITGDIGVSPIGATAITGFGLTLDSSNTFASSSLATGRVYAADYAAPTPSAMTTAVSSMEAAYTDAAGRTLPVATELGSGNIGGMTLTRGLYKWTTGVTIPTDLTLSGGANDVWIFQIEGTLNISSARSIILSGGAQAKNIFWQVAGQTTIGTTAVFNGNILDQTAIVIENGATLNGRALAQTAVTLDANTITAPAASSAKAITAFNFTSPAATGVI
ncbi:MAG: ice-binding family protein, partial [bacterium]